MKERGKSEFPYLDINLMRVGVIKLEDNLWVAVVYVPALLS
jgi:hypothetical protein